MAKRRTALLALALLCIVSIAWIAWGNTALEVTPYTVTNPQLPQEFSGFRIAQVSDLHNVQMGKNNGKLLAMLEASQPDLIAITGDMVDSRRTDLDVALDFAREAVKIAPTYYVPGNHEARIPEYPALKAALKELGVVILENESRMLGDENGSITLAGLTDPDFGIPWQPLSAENYQVVLSHRPELLTRYAELGFDLVFTGHAHGGQFRLPLIGGLFAPHQGFFPQYTSGIHTQGDTAMVISRGLGNSAFPLRFYNRPELVVVTLESV